MKYYISYLLFGLLALTFVSCNTDDLQKDVDALKDRVASYEAQVQQLNDEMNIVRVLLDGNKTITDYSKKGDTYTLTLSNGETLTLTPGVVGGNYPSIEIGENGNWVVAGKDTGLRAKSEDGEDSTITPQFKVEANPADGGKKYWYVSYDEGATWEVLENGLAEGVNTLTSPISNVTVTDDYMEVTLSGGANHRLPIVRGLVCAINKPDGLVDNVWAVASGGESSFTVKVNLAEGDLVRVKAPVEWKTKLTGNTAGSTEVTVTVTAPSTPSQCVIAVEVTHGVSTAADHLKVRTASDSYYADYNAGFDIRIGDLIVNKYDNPGGLLVQDGGTISANGFYFLAEGATVDWTGGTSDLIVLPEKKSALPTLNITKTLSLGEKDKEGLPGVILKGIRLNCFSGNQSFGMAANTTMNKVIFEHCQIDMAPGKYLAYLNVALTNPAGKVVEFLIQNCRFSIPATTSAIGVLSLANNAKSDKVTIRNNIFYCSEENKAALIWIFSGDVVRTAGNPTIIRAELKEVYIENNTIINVLSNHGTSSGYLKYPLQDSWTMKNNLIWYNNDWPVTATGIGWTASMLADYEGGSINAADVADNKVFTTLLSTQMVWQCFRTRPGSFANTIIPSTENPFESLTATEGKYVLKPAYYGIGANID